jgi:hypothetical protein
MRQRVRARARLKPEKQLLLTWSHRNHVSRLLNGTAWNNFKLGLILRNIGQHVKLVTSTNLRDQRDASVHICVPKKEWETTHVGGLSNSIRSDDVRFWQIVLKKPFLADERKFLGPPMRFVRGNVRDHIDSPKIDHGPA